MVHCVINCQEGRTAPMFFMKQKCSHFSNQKNTLKKSMLLYQERKWVIGTASLCCCTKEGRGRWKRISMLLYRGRKGSLEDHLRVRCSRFERKLYTRVNNLDILSVEKSTKKQTRTYKFSMKAATYWLTMQEAQFF